MIEPSGLSSELPNPDRACRRSDLFERRLHQGQQRELFGNAFAFQNLLELADITAGANHPIPESFLDPALRVEVRREPHENRNRDGNAFVVDGGVDPLGEWS